MTDTSLPKIYYIYDALCGWCYGFGPVMLKFSKQHQNEYEFQVLSGGMVTGEREGPISEVAGFISTAYHDVEKATGVKFGEKFLNETLEDGSVWFSSVPAALAMALFRTQLPDKSIEFAERIQRAIYYEGYPPAELETFGRCVPDFNLDGQLFQQKMEDPAVQELVQQEFHTVAQWGVRGFPTVILQKGNQAWALARGFTPLETLENTLQNVLAEINKK